MHDRKKWEEKKRMTIWPEEEENIDPEKGDKKSFDNETPISSISFYEKWWYTKEIEKRYSEKTRWHEVGFEIFGTDFSWPLSLEKCLPWDAISPTECDPKKLDDRIYWRDDTRMDHPIRRKLLEEIENDRSVIDEYIDSFDHEEEDRRSEDEEWEKWLRSSEPERNDIHKEKSASHDTPRCRRGWWVFLYYPYTKEWDHTREDMDFLLFANHAFFVGSYVYVSGDISDGSCLDSPIGTIGSSHEEEESQYDYTREDNRMYMDTNPRDREIEPRFHEKICDDREDEKEDNSTCIFRMTLHIVHRKWCTTLRQEK